MKLIDEIKRDVAAATPETMYRVIEEWHKHFLDHQGCLGCDTCDHDCSKGRALYMRSESK